MKHEAAILAALPGLAKEILLKTGIAAEPLRLSMLKLKAQGKLHIAAYEDCRRGHGGRQGAVFAAGPGEDAPKMSAKKRNRRMNDRAKQMRIEKEAEARYETPLPVVEHAMRYAPNSVWAYAGMAA